MKNFYSLIKISPNPIVGDSLVIGLVLFSGKKSRLFISQEKKNIAYRLLSISKKELDSIINTICEKTYSSDVYDSQDLLFEKTNYLASSEYFNYLNSYSNGLIQFSTPFLLNKEINDKDFASLVKSLFNESLESNKKEDFKFADFQNHINNLLISKVNDKVHVNFRFEKSKFPDIFFNYEMDVIGKNGQLIGAKSLSFEQSVQSLQNNIYKYFTLIPTLSSKFNTSLKDNLFYLISDEPDLSKKNVHQLWETIKRNPIIEVIPVEQSNLVAEKILDRKASKFL
ncbi:hypothetical protein [Portibacter marinus]|uniref:hypothetical protein n=1 Tax=Portibacter marinus TaxID=2898660 RepID=UPI001F1ABB46|nr:hypothetical protein [Portibacter marinus]